MEFWVFFFDFCGIFWIFGQILGFFRELKTHPHPHQRPPDRLILVVVFLT